MVDADGLLTHSKQASKENETEPEQTNPFPPISCSSRPPVQNVRSHPHPGSNSPTIYTLLIPPYPIPAPCSANFFCLNAFLYFVLSYVTNPTTINAITLMPPNTPNPMGSTCSDLPGTTNADAEADAAALSAALEAEGTVSAALEAAAAPATEEAAAAAVSVDEVALAAAAVSVDAAAAVEVAAVVSVEDAAAAVDEASAALVDVAAVYRT